MSEQPAVYRCPHCTAATATFGGMIAHRATAHDEVHASESGQFHKVMTPQSAAEIAAQVQGRDERPAGVRAAEMLRQAAKIVSSDRDATHGDKWLNHTNIARVWNAYLGIRRTDASPLMASDVALMMALLKIARTQLGNFNADDYLDGAGYMACAGEIADKEPK